MPNAVLIGIAVDPTDDKKVLAVFSNYGVSSIWYTNEAHLEHPNWSQVEGNLNLQSIRSCAIVDRCQNPSARECYVGTSVGLWGTTALNGPTTLWERVSSSDIKFAIVSSLQLRATDNGFLVGTHGNGMYYTQVGCVLPVELNNFLSSVNANNVSLGWKTTAESNNQGFDIERTLVNKNSGQISEWIKVGFVQGNGTTTSPINYSFIDRSLNTGKYNYRLKQIDFNGNFKYFYLSDEIIIDIPTRYDLSQNYPNPFNPTTKINYDLPFDGKVSIKLFDMS